MPKFDVQDIYPTAKTDQENEATLEYFGTIAFPDIPHDEIILILRQNRSLWQSVWVRKGKESDTFNYPEGMLKLAKGKKVNIISLIITGIPKSITFVYELIKFAEDFSITAAHTLPDGKVIYILFFVKK